MFKSSLTTSLIAGVLSLPSLGLAQATTSPKENEQTGDHRSSQAVSQNNLNTKNKNKTAAFLPKVSNSVGSVRTLITNLSSLSSSKEYLANASLDRTDAKPSFTSIEPKTANSNREYNLLANQNLATSPESSTTTLTAKPRSQVHVVSRGDTISKIARQYGVSKDDLVRLNQLNNSNVIFVSQRLKVPTTNILASTEPLLNTLQQSTPATSSAPAKVTNKEPDKATSSSNLNSDRHTTAKDNSYITKSRAEIEQSPNQKQQSLQANRNVSAPKNLRSSKDRVRITRDDATTQIETVSAATSVPASNSRQNLLLKDSIALQLPPLPPADEYLPTAFDGYIWPAQGILTSGYGWRWGRMHRGIDIAAPIGTPIVAAASGEVINVGWQSGYGNVIKLKHLDGSVTVYGHNHKNLVIHGQKVEQGEQIAEMGNTGRSTGPHLHFEIRLAGEAAIDPLALLGGK